MNPKNDLLIINYFWMINLIGNYEMVELKYPIIRISKIAYLSS